jgi:SAM-dependent methyltransferase
MAARIRLRPHLLAIFVSDASPGRLATTTSFGALARPFLGEVHEVLVRAVRSFTQARDRPLRALDIGMGMGDGAITGLLLGDAQLAVTGVDNEPKMIKKACEHLAPDLSSGRLKIVLDDALHFLTNQPSHTFDIIASGYVLHNLIGDYRAHLMTRFGGCWLLQDFSSMPTNMRKQ